MSCILECLPAWDILGDDFEEDAWVNIESHIRGRWRGIQSSRHKVASATRTEVKTGMAGAVHLTIVDTSV